MSERFMKDFNGDKVFSLEYDKETLKDMVLEKQEENEKLHSIIKEVREYIEKNKVMTQGHFDGKQWAYQYYELICDPNELLEILDKENK